MSSYPGSIVSYINPSGSNLLTSPDHALTHTSENNEIIAIETVLGTTGGTSVLKNFTAGNFAARTNNETFGSPTVTGGTFNNIVLGTPALTGGTANSINLGTPTINGSVLSTGTTTGVIFGAAIAPGIGTITDSAGGTFVVNAAVANIYYSVQGTGAGNRTIGTPTNPIPYQQLTYAFKTSGSANGTLVWSSPFRISQTFGTPTLGTGVGWNYYGWRYNSIDTKWDFLGQILNLI